MAEESARELVGYEVKLIDRKSNDMIGGLWKTQAEVNAFIKNHLKPDWDVIVLSHYKDKDGTT